MRFQEARDVNHGRGCHKLDHSRLSAKVDVGRLWSGMVSHLSHVHAD